MRDCFLPQPPLRLLAAGGRRRFEPKPGTCAGASAAHAHALDRGAAADVLRLRQSHRRRQPAPLQVTISNTGTAPLNVTGIALNSPTGGPYALAVGGGAKPCGATTRTIAAADSCTVQVLFQPTTDGAFNATLQVSSNAPNAPTVSLAIAGSSEQVQTLSVRVNQIEVVCAPSTPANTATAYVSVTDQGGFSVLGLLAANFLITQGAMSVPPPTANYVNQVYKNVAIAALLDFSKSLRDQPVAFADMKTGFSNFFGSLKPNDVAEVIRFATENEVTQPFTTDVAALRAAIDLPFNKGDGTRLYDTVFLGIDNVVNSRTSYPGYRGVVIVATDGDRQNFPPPHRLSTLCSKS